MEVAVDHDLHVCRAEVVLGERVGGVAVHDLPFLDELGRPADPSVDQDRTRARVLDHEPMHRHLIELADTGEVEADDLHYGMNGETAKTANRSATYTIE